MQQLRATSSTADAIASSAASLVSQRQQVYDDFFYPAFDGANSNIADGKVQLDVAVSNAALRERLTRVGLLVRQVPNSASLSPGSPTEGLCNFQITVDVHQSTHDIMIDVIKAASLLESQAAALAVPGSSRAVAASAGSSHEAQVLEQHLLPLAQGCVLKLSGLRDFIHCDASRPLARSRSLQDSLSAGQRALRCTLQLKRHVAGASRLTPSALVVDSSVSAPLLHTLAVHRQRTASDTPPLALRHASAEWPLRVRILRARNLIPALLHAKVPTRNTAALPKSKGKHKAPEAAPGDRTRALSFGMLERPFRMSTTSRSDSGAGPSARASKRVGNGSVALGARRGSQGRVGPGGAAMSGSGGGSGGSLPREASMLSMHSEGEGGVTADMQAGIVQIPGSKASAQLDSVFVRLDVVYGGEVLPGCSAESRRRQWAPHIHWTPGTVSQSATDHTVGGGGAGWLAPERLLRDIPQEAQLRFTVLAAADSLPEPVVLGVAAIPLVDHRGVVVSGRHTVACWPGNTDVRSARVGVYASAAGTFLAAHGLAEEQEEAQRNTLGATDIVPGLESTLSARASGSRLAWGALTQAPAAEAGALQGALALEASVALGLSTTAETQHDASELTTELVQRSRRSLLVPGSPGWGGAFSGGPAPSAGFSDDDSDGEEGEGTPAVRGTWAPRSSSAQDVGDTAPSSGSASPVPAVDGTAAGRAAAESAITALGGAPRQSAARASMRPGGGNKRRTGSVYYTGEDWGQGGLGQAVALALQGEAGSRDSGTSSARGSVLQLADGSSVPASGTSTPPVAASAVARSKRLSRAARADSGFEFQNRLGMLPIGEDGGNSDDSAPDEEGDAGGGDGVGEVAPRSPPLNSTPLEDKRPAADVATMEAPAFLIPTLPESDTSELYEAAPLTLEIDVEAFRLPVVADAPPTSLEVAATAARAEALGMAAVADCKAAHKAVLAVTGGRRRSTTRPRPGGARPPAPPSGGRPRPPSAPDTPLGGGSQTMHRATEGISESIPEGTVQSLSGDGGRASDPAAEGQPDTEVVAVAAPLSDAEHAAAQDVQCLECCNPYAAYARLRFALLCLGVDAVSGPVQPWGAATSSGSSSTAASQLHALAHTHGVHVHPWLQHLHASPTAFAEAVQARLCAMLPPGQRRDAAVAALRSGAFPLAAALSIMLSPAHLARHLVTDEALVYTQPHVPLLIAPRAGAAKWGTGIAMQDSRYRGFYDTVPFGMQADAVSSSGDMQAAFAAAISGSRTSGSGGSTPRALALPGSVDPTADRAAGLQGRTGLNFDAEFHIAVDKRGWMRKLGKQSWSRWRRRWFVLTERGGSLRYYEGNTAGQPPKGVVPLAGMAARAEPGKDRSYQRIVGSTRKNLALYCFRLGPSGEGEAESDRTYFLYTEAKRAMEEWIDAINTVALRLGTGEALSPVSRAQRGAGEPLSPVVLSVSPRHKDRAADAGATVAIPPVGAGMHAASGSGSPTSGGEGGNRTPPSTKRASKWGSLKRMFKKDKAAETDTTVGAGAVAVPSAPAPAAGRSATPGATGKQRRGRRPSLMLAGVVAATAGDGSGGPRGTTAAAAMSITAVAAVPDGPRRRAASNAQPPGRRGSVFAAAASDSTAPISVLHMPVRPPVVELLQATMQSETPYCGSVGGARLREEPPQAKRSASSGSRMALSMFRGRSSSGGAYSTVLRGVAGAECAPLGDTAAALQGLWGAEDAAAEALGGDAPGFWDAASSGYAGLPCSMGGDVLGWSSVLEEVCNGSGSRVALPLGALGEMASAGQLQVPPALQALADAPPVEGGGAAPPSAAGRPLRELLARRAGSHVLREDADGGVEHRNSLFSLITTPSRRSSEGAPPETALVLLRPSAEPLAPQGAGSGDEARAAAEAVLRMYPMLAPLLPGSSGGWWAVHSSSSSSSNGEGTGHSEGLQLRVLGRTWTAPASATCAADVVAGDKGALAALLQRFQLARGAAEGTQGRLRLPQLASLAGGLQVLALWMAVRSSLATFACIALHARSPEGAAGAAAPNRAARVRRASVDGPNVQAATGPALHPAAVEQLRAWHVDASHALRVAADWGLRLPPVAAADARAAFSAGATGAAARDVTSAVDASATTSSASSAAADAEGPATVDGIAATARRLLLLLRPLRAVLHGAVAIALAQDAIVQADAGAGAGVAAAAEGAAGTGMAAAPWLPLALACSSAVTRVHLGALGACGDAAAPLGLAQAAACLRRASGLPAAEMAAGEAATVHSGAPGEPLPTDAADDAAEAGSAAVHGSRGKLQRLLEQCLPPVAAADARVWALLLPAQRGALGEPPAQAHWRAVQLPPTYKPRNESRERLAEGRRRSHTGVHSDWRSMRPAANSDAVADALPAAGLLDDAALQWSSMESRPSHVDVEQGTVRVEQGLPAATALALRGLAAEYVAACWQQLNGSDAVTAEWAAPRLALLFGAAGDTGHVTAQLAQHVDAPLRASSIRRGTVAGIDQDAAACLLGVYCTAAEREASSTAAAEAPPRSTGGTGGNGDSVVPVAHAVATPAAWKQSAVLTRDVFRCMVAGEGMRLRGQLVLPPGAPDSLHRPALAAELALPQGGVLGAPFSAAREAEGGGGTPTAAEAAAVLRAHCGAAAPEGAVPRVGELDAPPVDCTVGFSALPEQYEVPTWGVPLLGGSDSLQYVLQDSAGSAGRTLAQARTLGRQVLQLTQTLSHTQHWQSRDPVASLLHLTQAAGAEAEAVAEAAPAASSWWAAGPAARHTALVLAAVRLRAATVPAALLQAQLQLAAAPAAWHVPECMLQPAPRSDWGAPPHSASVPPPVDVVPGDSAGTLTAMVLDAVARCGDGTAPSYAVGVLTVDPEGHITSLGASSDLLDFQMTPMVQAALNSRSERDAAASPARTPQRMPTPPSPLGSGGAMRSVAEEHASPATIHGGGALTAFEPRAGRPVCVPSPLSTLAAPAHGDVSLDLPDGVQALALQQARLPTDAEHAWLPPAAQRVTFAGGLALGDTADSDDDDGSGGDSSAVGALLQAAADSLSVQLGSSDRPARLSRVERRSLADNFRAGSSGSVAASSRTLALGGSPLPSRTASHVALRSGTASTPSSSDSGLHVSKPRLRLTPTTSQGPSPRLQPLSAAGAAPGTGTTLGAVGGAMLPNIFEKLFAADPLRKMSTMERAAVWQHRAAITHLPEALPKLVSAIAWVSRTQAREAHRLLYAWKPFPAPVAARYLELLDERHADQQVRAKAVAGLQALTDEEVTEMVPQLVQALKFEPHLSSPLFLWLLRRALRSPLAVGMPLYWNLEVEAGGNPVTYSTVAVLMRAFSSQMSPPARALLSTQQALWGREGAFARICEHVMMHRKQGKDKLQHIARSALRSLAEQLPSQHVLPLDGRMEVGRLLVDKCKVMDSAKKPLWLVFDNADPAIAGTDHPDAKVIVMFKAGDDIRQDTVVLQLIRCMDRLWKAQGLDMCMSPYRCAPTWNDGGMLEIVTSSDTTANIQTRYGGTLGAFSDSVFKQWIEEHNGAEGTPEYDEAVRMFIRSAAGYCVATYVLGIGDRHNDNIMIKKTGHYFHIDFGHFLGNFKYQFGLARELTGFVFTPEMLEVMGGREGAGYKRFLELGGQAFNIVRKHAAELINLLSLMLPCRMPELRTRDDILYLKERLALGLGDEAAAALFKTEAEAALSDTRKRIDNTIHILVHR